MADLGYHSLAEIRGQTDLLHLINHECMVGQLDFSPLLTQVEVVKVEKPIYLEANFSIDDKIIAQVKSSLIDNKQTQVVIEGSEFKLNNRHKTLGGQAAIDIERMLAYQLSDEQRTTLKTVYQNQHGRYYFAPDSIVVRTTGSAGQSYGAFLNDGMRMEHTGTCNDGVGKTMCGGTIIVKSPGGGSNALGENVLIGNFALFGASGGKAFINGEGGDRFAVRNSGAMAVVEGVGDFGCEYMINGAVLNLGGFGKGFCTGMSGGNAYQYDPENRLKDLYDDSSVEIRNLTEESDVAAAHEQFILYMLEQHIEYTDSEKAKAILENWANERQHFFVALPLWLYKTQTAQFILPSTDRKAMIEELAVSYANQQTTELKQAYQSKSVLFNGKIPEYGEIDSKLTFKLINSFSVLNKAEQLVKDQLKTMPAAAQTDVLINQQIAKLITERPRKLQDALLKNTREAYSAYSDEQLASLLAAKRLNDYKAALIKRDVQSIYSMGTTAWIMEQDKINREALSGLTCVEEHLARHASLEVVQAMLVT